MFEVLWSGVQARWRQEICTQNPTLDDLRIQTLTKVKGSAYWAQRSVTEIFTVSTRRSLAPVFIHTCFTLRLLSWVSTFLRITVVRIKLLCNHMTSSIWSEGLKGKLGVRRPIVHWYPDYFCWRLGNQPNDIGGELCKPGTHWVMEESWSPAYSSFYLSWCESHFLKHLKECECS